MGEVGGEIVVPAPLAGRVRRLVDGEVEAIRRRSRGALTEKEAGAVLAFVLGALVLGAFAPRKTAGFAAAGARRLAGVR